MSETPHGNLLLTNIGRLCSWAPADTPSAHTQLLVEAGRIRWTGATDDAPPFDSERVYDRIDCGGRVVLPGLVDCHTHLVFGGNRVGEFAERAAGVSYETIAARGGGIRSTVRATREADDDALYAAASARLDRMLDWGVTCVEIKSGYGLDLETELRMLRVARRLGEDHPVRTVGTFLGAHSVPPEFQGRPDAYLDHVIEVVLPAVAAEGLADFCDVFCEHGVFDPAQSRRVLEAGRALGLLPKVHAEQLHHTGGTQLGVELGAASVDHLEAAEPADIRALSESDTVAVLLPGATLFLGMDRWPPARALLDAGATVALSTDCNPGSSMCEDLRLMTTLGCTRLGMSPDESLRAVTWSAAKALRLEAERGHLGIGAVGDCVVFDTDNEAEIPYRFGQVDPWAVVVAGELVRGAAAV